MQTPVYHFLIVGFTTTSLPPSLPLIHTHTHTQTHTHSLNSPPWYKRGDFRTERTIFGCRLQQRGVCHPQSWFTTLSKHSTVSGQLRPRTHVLSFFLITPSHSLIHSLPSLSACPTRLAANKDSSLALNFIACLEMNKWAWSTSHG